MEELMGNAVILVPMIILQVALALTAVIHVIRHPNYRFGNKAIWIIIVCFIQFIGPIVYFVFGRGDE